MADPAGSIRFLDRKSRLTRRRVLEMCVRAQAGHIAPSFSCVDILVALFYSGLLRHDPRRPRWSGRDRLVLSKGHSANALFAILSDRGVFARAELSKFIQAGGLLGTHCDDFVPGAEVTNGSLGHGLAVGAGMALAARSTNQTFRTFVLAGDGECQEGSHWEAAMWAAHQKLATLTLIVDANGMTATGPTGESVGLEPLEGKFRAFGWQTACVDGHSHADLLRVLSVRPAARRGKPLAVIARTVKGRGVRFMENNSIWHYRIPQGRELRQAREQLAGTPAAKAKTRP